MNSRPLCALSTDPNDLKVLTPGHFLIGRPPDCLPEPLIDDNFCKLSNLCRWKRIVTVQQAFWKRWTKEFLSLLQEKQKWLKPVDNIMPGTLVLIADDNAPSNQWLLRRVVSTHAGDDGLGRVVTLKTKSGVVKRNVHKICPLPMQD